MQTWFCGLRRPDQRYQGENTEPGFRTSLGVANLAAVWTGVEITLYDHNGVMVGQTTKSIKPLSMMQ
jgi:hypothetical protein